MLDETNDRRTILKGALALLLGLSGEALVPSSALAQKKYDTGASDTEIKLGQTIPYSGPVSAYALVGHIMVAYFKMVNEEKGGINGRKVTFISVDDAFSPPKTFEQTRKLVEDDGVLAIAASMGSITSLAVAKYLNNKKIPQILLTATSKKLNDPALYPYTTTFYPSTEVETEIYAKYQLATNPNAKIGVIYQDDDLGRSYRDGLKEALGSKASMIVKEASFTLGDPTVDTQILTLKVSGADTLFIAATAKFAAQAIRKAHELGWKPDRYLITPSASILNVLKPAGLATSKGIVSSLWIKYSDNPAWKDDPAMKEFFAFFKKYLPGYPAEDGPATSAYTRAQMLEEVLRRCGDELTHENIIKQATNIKDYQIPLYISGVKINITPTDRRPWHQSLMHRFDGENWIPFGDIMSADPTP